MLREFVQRLDPRSGARVFSRSFGNRDAPASSSPHSAGVSRRATWRRATHAVVARRAARIDGLRHRLRCSARGGELEHPAVAEREDQPLGEAAADVRRPLDAAHGRRLRHLARLQPRLRSCRSKLEDRRARDAPDPRHSAERSDPVVHARRRARSRRRIPRPHHRARAGGDNSHLHEPGVEPRVQLPSIARDDPSGAVRGRGRLQTGSVAALHASGASVRCNRRSSRTA